MNKIGFIFCHTVSLLSLCLGAAGMAVGLSAVAATSEVSASVSTTDIRPLEAAVTKVVMSGPIDLILKPSATPELLLRGDAKLLSRVTTRIEGNTLYVGTRSIFISIGTSPQTRLELSLPHIDKVQMQGSGNGNMKGFRGNQLELVSRGSGGLYVEGEYQRITTHVSGSGDVNLSVGNSDQVDIALYGSGDVNVKGQAKNVQIKLTGSGNLDASGLRAQQVSVQSTGTGDARLLAVQELQLRLAGTGNVHVFGQPGKRQIERKGTGELYWEDGGNR